MPYGYGLAIGKYGAFPPVNIFVPNNFHRSLNIGYFRLEDAAVIWYIEVDSVGTKFSFENFFML